MGDLLCWGVREGSLHGLDLGLGRLAALRSALPSVFAIAANGGVLPFRDRSFGLVVASTVFTSILDGVVRRLVANEIRRCLRPGGALLIYDFAFDNPRNPNVSAFGKREALELFGPFEGHVRRVTLAPPLARRVAPRSWFLASALEAIPLLRSHILAVFKKPL